MVKGGYFLRNITAGILGLAAGGALWLVTSIIGAMDAWDDGETSVGWFVLMGFGFALMIGAPAIFWIVLPIWHRIHKPGSQPGNQNEGR